MASVVTAQHAEESATMALKKKSAVLESIEDITYGSVSLNRPRRSPCVA